ncbi:MAG: PHP domain-containing protein [Bacteroidales bacterium]|nr:PHP domain-containing protein [Bacteroidales bacterium]
MKKTLCLIAAAFTCACLSAQTKEQAKENPDLFRAIRNLARTEILIPDVDGFKAIKTDLHVHTVYSDGDCSPEYRVKEGWRDGLDAIAITDHIEYRPNDSKMKRYLGSDQEVKANLNLPVELAKNASASYGILVIPGIEITRDPQNIGHFNALFTTDNNKIPDGDPLVAIRNAKAQDAVIQFNHPGWARGDANFTETAKKAMAEGMIDGIESFNGEEFYPKNIEDAVNNNCYVASNSDIHATTYDYYLRSDYFRNMTIVFAKECSLPAIKEALLAQRTIAYGCGTLSGSREMLEKFFYASVEIKNANVDGNGNGTILLTNKTSFPFLLNGPTTSVNVLLPPLSTIRVSIKNGQELKYSVSNMFYGVDKNLEVSIKL